MPLLDYTAGHLRDAPQRAEKANLYVKAAQTAARGEVPVGVAAAITYVTADDSYTRSLFELESPEHESALYAASSAHETGVAARLACSWFSDRQNKYFRDTTGGAATVAVEDSTCAAWKATRITPNFNETYDLLMASVLSDYEKLLRLSAARGAVQATDLGPLWKGNSESWT